MILDEDVPSSVDLRSLDDAKLWEEEANIKRPWRYAFFQYYSYIIQQYNCINILEIGSGPGFLAEYLLSQNQSIKYTALDFSIAMHQCAKSRIATTDILRINFVHADFKQMSWFVILEDQKFDLVIIHQALHELRHKKYAAIFHQQVKKLLAYQGIYLICDHIFAEDAMQNNQLYMSKDEHVQALKDAQFFEIIQPLVFKGLCLFQCK